MSSLNTQYFANLTAQVNAVPCDHLPALVTKILDKVNTLETSIQNRINAIAPLLVVPTNLPGVLTWIENMINQYVVPYNKELAQLAELEAAVVTLQAAISNKVRQCAETVISAIPPL